MPVSGIPSLAGELIRQFGEQGPWSSTEAEHGRRRRICQGTSRRCPIFCLRQTVQKNGGRISSKANQIGSTGRGECLW